MCWHFVDKRIQSDQKDINWEFLDEKELAKQGEIKLLLLCNAFFTGISRGSAVAEGPRDALSLEILLWWLFIDWYCAKLSSHVQQWQSVAAQ